MGDEEGERSGNSPADEAREESGMCVQCTYSITPVAHSLICINTIHRLNSVPNDNLSWHVHA